MSDDELMKSFQQSLNLGPDGGGGDGEASFIPMMQNMMSNLLSKEILYPSLKDLADKVSLLRLGITIILITDNYLTCYMRMIKNLI